jgi:hypothetical protein
MKEKYMEMIESQPLTKAIHNAGKVLNMNIIEINKISSKLKMWSFKIPHYAYTNRCTKDVFSFTNSYVGLI